MGARGCCSDRQFPLHCRGRDARPLIHRCYAWSRTASEPCSHPSLPPSQVRRLLVDAREEVKTMLTARMQVGRVEGRGGGRGEETGRKGVGPHAHPLTQSPAVLIFPADR